MAALETRHRGGTLSQQINDLTLALITPLGTDDDDEFSHGNASPSLEGSLTGP
jgi:hypothetical protein